MAAGHPAFKREDRLGKDPFAGFGTVVEDITESHFGPKKFDRAGRGVEGGQTTAQNGPLLWRRRPLGTPKLVKDPRNGLKSIRGL